MPLRVRCGLVEGPAISACPSNRSEIQDESQRGVHASEFLEGEMTSAPAEPGGIDRGGLLGENQGRAAGDLYLGSEGRWSR